MNIYSEASLKALQTCDVRLQLVAKQVLQFMDHAILVGHRTKEDQDKAFENGNSKVRWPDSKHNVNPSLALDVAPYIPKYGIIIGHPGQVQKLASMVSNDIQRANAFIREAYTLLAGFFLCTARRNGFELRWGGDWNGEYDLLQNSFDDLGHFELKV